MFRLDGKVALVTGCGTLGEGWGNGKAIAVARPLLRYFRDAGDNDRLAPAHRTRRRHGPMAGVEQRDEGQA